MNLPAPQDIISAACEEDLDQLRRQLLRRGIHKITSGGRRALRADAVSGSGTRQRALNEHATALKGQYDVFQRQIEMLEREAGVLKQQLGAAQANVEALHNSASWRAAAPLRAVYRILR